MLRLSAGISHVDVHSLASNVYAKQMCCERETGGCIFQNIPSPLDRNLLIVRGCPCLQYCFPTQQETLDYTMKAVKSELFNSRALFVFGTYTIGKERLFLEVSWMQNSDPTDYRGCSSSHTRLRHI